MRRKTVFLLLAVLLGLLVLPLPAAAQAGPRIIFLHHSCGHNLIEEGGVREGLTALGYQFFDHGYNGDGLRLADGTWTGEHFDIPDDNTDPDGIEVIFNQPLTDPPANAFSHLMQYDVIIFKSCFPTSNIPDDDTLAWRQQSYLSIRARMAGHPEKLFIVVTQPPQVPGSSSDDEATRARQLADWLGSDAFLQGGANVATFDFFDHLAGPDNYLQRDYRYDNWDAHPNTQANAIIGPQFVAFIDAAVRDYYASNPPGEAPPEPELIGEPEEPAAELPGLSNETLGPGAVVADFDDGLGDWTLDADMVNDADCIATSERAFAGSGAAQLILDLQQFGWGGCWHGFERPQDWSNAAGISFALQAEPAGAPLALLIFSGEQTALTAYEYRFSVPPEATGGWVEYALAWSEFERAPWAEPDAPYALDTTRVGSIGFETNADDGPVQLNVVFDEIRLLETVDSAPPAEPAPVEDEPAPPADVPAPDPEAEPLGGLCGLPGAVLPLIALGLVLARRWR